MIQNKLEAFSVIETNIGSRIAYRYATINTDKGTVDLENTGNIPIIVDEKIKEYISAIEEYILSQISKK